MVTSEVKTAGDIVGEVVLEEREYECPQHGKYYGRPVYIAWCKREIDPMCPVCEEEKSAKYAAAEQIRLEEQQRQQAEANEQKRIEWLKGLNIGKIFWNESFETFNAYTPELQRHLSNCMAFAKEHKGRKVVMLGNNGTGKNHLAASILKVTGGVIYKIMEIELMFDKHVSGDIRRWEIIKKLCEAEMLIIDEIGRSKASEHELNWLSYVIDKRHENYMPLVLISNKHLKDNCPQNGCADCLQNFMGNDILSRITENGLIMEFTGEDYREKKRFQSKGAK